MRVVRELTFSVLYDQFCMYIFYSTRSHTMVFEEIIKKYDFVCDIIPLTGPGGSKHVPHFGMLYRDTLIMDISDQK